LVIELALATQTPPEAWMDDERALLTALEVMTEQADARGRNRAPGAGSPQFSG
jgi:hypothetical protein